MTTNKSSPIVSIITPLYNDEISVLETLESVTNQTYSNIQHIIVDDGSTDHSYQVVSKYVSEYTGHIDYVLVSQKNADQLNAIINGMKYCVGSYIFILHSDDLFANDGFIASSVNIMQSNPSIDALIGNLELVDTVGNSIGIQKVKVYKKINSEIISQYLNLGRNQFIDVAFYRSEFFESKVLYNYLTWNTSFWLDLENEPESAQVQKINMNFICYRIHANNYINDTSGVFNVINGELRTVVSLAKYYYVPLYAMQNYLYRILNKLGIQNRIIIHFKAKSKNIYKVVRHVIKSRYDLNDLNDVYLNALLGFYKNIENSRVIYLQKLLDDEIIYEGNDVKLFYNSINTGQLSDFYRNFINEMERGFGKIVCSKIDYPSVLKIVRFMNIHGFVEIEVKV